VDINSIKQGTRDSLLIFRDNSGRTWTGLDGIPTITTGAGIHTRAYDSCTIKSNKVGLKTSRLNAQ
jgi:hypothetical protein